MRQSRRPHVAFGQLTVIEKGGIRQPREGGEAHRTRVRQAIHRHQVEVGGSIIWPIGRASVEPALVWPAEMLENMEPARPKPALAQQSGDCGRRGAALAEDQQMGVRVNLRMQRFERAPMRAEADRVLQRPAEPGRREREG